MPNIDDLIELVFEKKETTKANKSKLFKLAKAAQDISTIERMRDELAFKSAKVYLEKHNKTYIDDAIRNKDLKSLRILIENGADISYINLSELANNKYPLEYFQILLKAGVKTHKEDYSGKTGLIVAILQKNIELVNLLLEFGANANDYTFRFRTSRPHVIESPILEGETALHLAASIGELSIVESLIIYGAKIDAFDVSRLTPLMIAVWNGHLDIVKILLDNGADINVSDSNGVTPIIRASCEGHKEIVEFLLKQGVDVNKKDKSGRTAFMDASYFKHNDIVGLLLKYGADPIQKGKDITPVNDDLDVDESFMMACELKDQFLIQTHINRGANVNIQNSLGVTALMVLLEDPNLVEILLKAGANPNLQTNDGMTALFVAARDSHEKSIKLLIKYGANINISAEGITPLAIAIYNNHNKVAKLLIENDADINVKNLDGDNSALICALITDNYEMVNLLCDYEVNIDIADENRKTLLMKASINGYISILKRLIEEKINLNFEIDNYTPLMVAIEGQQLEAMDILIKNGANVNFKNIPNKTALIFAIHQPRNEDQIEIIKMLIKNNANLNDCDENGYTPLMLAIHFEKFDIAKLLIESGADVNMENIEGATALMFAVSKTDNDIVQLLINSKANVNHSNLNTFPLLIAAANKSAEILRLLLDYNVDINQQTQDGYTALMIATEEENTEAIKLLIENGADTTLKKCDYDYDDENEEHDTGLGDTALNIAIHRNDWETNDNIEAIKLILETRKIINSSEAAALDIYLAKKEISQLASNILVDMGGWYMTTLMHTLMINGSIWQVQKWGIGFNSVGKENREKDADEYMKYNILLNCKSLIESGVDINYEGGGTTALKSAEEMGMIEVIELLESYLEKNTLKLYGFITFNEDKYTIKVNDKGITFVNEVEEKIEKFQRDLEVKNRYINENGYVEINDKMIIQGRSEDDLIEYKIDSISGNPIEIKNNHNPKRLIEILNLFTQENPIKYTAHSFEWSRYGSYKIFMEKVKQEFEKIENDLKILSPNLYTKIYKFLFDRNLNKDNAWGMSKMDFGWSSPELKEWSITEENKPNGLNAFDCELPEKHQKSIKTFYSDNKITIDTFEKVCDIFKNEIEIRDDDKLILLFQNVEEEILGFDFDVEYKNLDGITFYTDVENFRNGLKLIFKQFKTKGREKYDHIIIEAVESTSNESYIDIKIIQKGSEATITSKDMIEKIKTGDFQSIKDKHNLKSLCDWKIEAMFKDGAFEIDNLSFNVEDISIEPMKGEAIGFTYILRFYK